MSKKHDALFKQVFGQVEQGRELLAYALPPEIAEHIDWRSLKTEGTTFADTQHADLLFSATQAGRRTLFYFLLEHKSEQKPFTIFQLHGYIQRIWQRERKLRPQRRKLPVVLPIVVYHGRSPWATPTQMLDVVDFDEQTRASMQGFVPSFGCLLLTLREEELLRAQQLSALSRLSATLMAALRDGSDQVAAVTRCAPLVAQALAAGRLKELEPVLLYVMRLVKLSPDELGRLWRSHLDHETEERLMSNMEILAEDWLKEGGESILLSQLRARFGPLDPGIVERIGACNSAQIRQLAIRFLDAKSPEELFDED